MKKQGCRAVGSLLRGLSFVFPLVFSPHACHSLAILLSYTTYLVLLGPLLPCFPFPATCDLATRKKRVAPYLKEEREREAFFRPVRRE